MCTVPVGIPLQNMSIHGTDPVVLEELDIIESADQQTDSYFMPQGHRIRYRLNHPADSGLPIGRSVRPRLEGVADCDADGEME